MKKLKIYLETNPIGLLSLEIEKTNDSIADIESEQIQSLFRVRSYDYRIKSIMEINPGEKEDTYIFYPGFLPQVQTFEEKNFRPTEAMKEEGEKHEKKKNGIFHIFRK